VILDSITDLQVVPETSLIVTWIKHQHISESHRNPKPFSCGTVTTDRCLIHIRDAAHSERKRKSAEKFRLLDKNENLDICQNTTQMIRPGPFNLLPTERKQRKLGLRFSENLHTWKRKKTLAQKYKFWNLSKSNVRPIQSASDWEKEPKIGSSMVPSGGRAATSRQSAPSPLCFHFNFSTVVSSRILSFLTPQAVFCEGPSRSWFAASRMSLRRLYNVLEESLMWCDMYSIALQRLPRRHGGARMWLLKKISPRIYKGELWGRWGCAQVVEMYCIKERQRENGREPERSMQCFKLSLDNWLYWTRFDARSWIHMFPSSFLSFFLFFFGWRMPSFIT